MEDKTIVAVYTGQGLAEPLQKIFKEHLPDCRFINIIDDSIIYDVNQVGEVSKSVIRRLLTYYQTAVDIGADIIVNTCSSVGEVVDIARNIIDVPIIKIDEPMVKKAVENYDKIGVLATLPTTLNPTIRLLKSQASILGKEIAVVDGLAKGAYQALIAGSPEEHDRLIRETAKSVAKEVDCIVLAQGSMARIEKDLRDEIGLEVLSSPYLCVQAVKKMLEDVRS